MIMFVPPGSTSAGTLSGSTGLITLGTADTLSVGTAELGFRQYRHHLTVTGMYGMLPDVEVGLQMPLVNGGLDEVGLVLKGVVAAETASTPGVAIGFEPEKSYIVASKRLLPRLRFHAAYLHGDVKGPAAGLAYSVNTASLSPSAISPPATTLMAEYTPAGVNVGARLLFGTLLSIDVALMDLERPTGGLTLRFEF